MSYLVDRHTQILFRTASVICNDGRRRPIVADPRAEFVVLALAGTKKRFPVSWDRIYRLALERGDSEGTHGDRQAGHLLLRTASCIYQTGRARPILVEPRPHDLLVALSGTAGTKHAVSWERVYWMGRELDAINARFEENALKAQSNHELQHRLRLRKTAHRSRKISAVT